MRIEHYDEDGKLIQAATVDTPERDNRDAIEAQARQALAANRTYIAIASPTAAQTTAEVKALARQNNGLIRLLLGLFDGAD